MSFHNIQFQFSQWQRYALAILIFLITLAMRFLFFFMNIGLGYSVFYLGMVLAFALCGLGPGILLTALATLSGYYFLFEPHFTFSYSSTGVISTVTFVVTAALIALIIIRLRNAETYLDELIQNSASAIITIDPVSGKFTTTNPAAQKLWGYSSEEFVTKTIQELTPADEWDVSRVLNEQLFRGEVDSLHFEKRYIRKDGSTFWAETHAAALKNAQGKARLFIGNTTDISERKLLEAQLQASEQRYRAVLDAQTELICRFTADGIIVYVNEAFCRFFNRDRTSLLGKHWQPVAHPDDLSLIQQKLAQLTPEQDTVTIENRVLVKPNEFRWCQFVNRGFFDDQGGLIELQAVARDISDRKFLTEQILNSKAEYEDLYDHAPCGYHSLDASGSIVKINTTEANWLGYTPQELIGRQFNDFFTAEGKALFQQSFPKFLQAGHIENLEFEIVGHAQPRRFISLNGNSVLNEQGEFVMSRSVLYDITQIKQAQVALAASETRFRNMANSAPVMIWMAGLDKQCYWFNDIWLAFTGRTLEQEKGKGWTEGVHPDDFDHCLAIYFSHFDNRQPFRMEYRLRHHDGEYRWLHDHGVPLFDELGNFSGYIGSCIDISDSKLQALQLNALAQEQQAMLDNELIGIAKVKDRQIIWKNKAMDRIFGYSGDELLGSSTEKFYPDHEAYQALSEKAYPILQQQQLYQDQIAMRRKDGQAVWVDLNGMLLNTQTNESLWLMSDITALKQHDTEVTNMAYHDILTGLPNRLLVSDRLQHAVAQAERSQRMLAICYVDLDGFKPVNDQYGHQAGDFLLKEIAQRMLASVRGNDTVGRLGGDEFVLLLTDLENCAEYQSVLKRLINAINQPIALDDSTQVKVGASIGITVFPADSEQPEMLLRHADQAMYQAKLAGRNRVCLYSAIRHSGDNDDSNQIKSNQKCMP